MNIQQVGGTRVVDKFQCLPVRAFISRVALLGKCSVQIPINFQYDKFSTVCVRDSTENPRLNGTAAD